MSFMLLDTVTCRNSVASNYDSMNKNADLRQDTEICDTIAGLVIEGSPESTGVTTFVQEACTAVSAVDSKYSSTLYPIQAELQDVRDYFSRPVAISSGTVASTRSAFFSNNYRFSDILALWPNGQTRLLGAYGIRAKVVFTLQVSATPFHQGLVCLCAQYGANFINPGCYNRASEPCTTTNLPHVVLDLSSDTMVQLHLPYLSVLEYSQVRSSNESLYILPSVVNLVPVPSVSGMGPPTYQLFVHLEDIALFGATPQAINSVVLTAGRKLSPVTEEFESDAFPFSSALHSTGKAISFLAKGVPSLSSIGGPVAWALGKAAGVVRYFGYGKPAVQDPVMRVFRQDNIGEFNTDVATSCMVLAATAGNTTSINTFVGASDVDEMALKYITSRWGQICVFSYSTGVASGGLLYGAVINPLAFYFRNFSALPAFNKPIPQVVDASGNSVQPSHLFFAAGSFKQWRGGIKYRFTFAKTKMHAGRVMVSYNPYYEARNDTNFMSTAITANFPEYGSAGPNPFGYSAIFDLKDGNVFEFKVPYVAPTPYSGITTITGALALYVVDPLIASSVVSSTISVVVEVAGDVDFELANPVGVMFPVHNSGTISVQAGRVLSEAPEQINQLTMGESITSVKQLIAIPHVSTFNDAKVSQVVPPWYYQPNFSALVPGSTTIPTESFSYGGNWASCYGFLKGGTDVHLYSQLQAVTFSLYQWAGTTLNVPTTATPDNRGHSNAPSIISAQFSLHARLPAFLNTVRIHSWVANWLTGASVSFPTNPGTSATSALPWYSPAAYYVAGGQTDPDYVGPSTYYMDRNAADDAQLAMYIGPPPVYIPPTPAVTGSFDTDGLLSGF